MKKQLSRILAATTGALALIPALTQTAYADGSGWTHHGMGWGSDWGWDGGHMLFGPLMMILFWGGLILLVILAVRWLGGGSRDSSVLAGSRTALDTLNERFARGEIDKGEFEERKGVLSSR